MEVVGIIAILAAMYLVGLSIIILIAKALSKTHPSSPFFWRPTPGDKGEYKVIEELSWLDKTHFFVINDLLFRKSNGLTTQIDHIVVSPYGVFVIETKKYYRLYLWVGDFQSVAEAMERACSGRNIQNK